MLDFVYKYCSIKDIIRVIIVNILLKAITRSPLITEANLFHSRLMKLQSAIIFLDVDVNASWKSEENKMKKRKK